MPTAVIQSTSQSSGLTDPLYLGVSLGNVKPLGNCSCLMRGPKQVGPAGTSSSASLSSCNCSMQCLASFSPIARGPNLKLIAGRTDAAAGGFSCLLLTAGSSLWLPPAAP